MIVETNKNHRIFIIIIKSGSLFFLFFSRSCVYLIRITSYRVTTVIKQKYYLVHH